MTVPASLSFEGSFAGAFDGCAGWILREKLRSLFCKLVGVEDILFNLLIPDFLFKRSATDVEFFIGASALFEFAKRPASFLSRAVRISF